MGAKVNKGSGQECQFSENELVIKLNTSWITDAPIIKGSN